MPQKTEPLHGSDARLNASVPANATINADKDSLIGGFEDKPMFSGGRKNGKLKSLMVALVKVAMLNCLETLLLMSRIFFFVIDEEDYHENDDSS